MYCKTETQLVVEEEAGLVVEVEVVEEVLGKGTRQEEYRVEMVETEEVTEVEADLEVENQIDNLSGNNDLPLPNIIHCY